MSDHKFVCEACGSCSARGQFGYLEIINPNNLEEEGRRYYLCNEHKAQIVALADDLQWVELYELRQEWIEREELLFNGEVLSKSPF